MGSNLWTALVSIFSFTVCFCNIEDSVFSDTFLSQCYEYETCKTIHLVEKIYDISLWDRFCTDINNISKKCLDELQNFSPISKDPSTNLLNLLDSFAKPPTGLLQGNFKWLGDWSECKSLNQTEYVRIVIPVPILLKGVSFVGVSLAPDIAVCLPTACSNRDDTLHIIDHLITLIQPDLPLNITEVLNTSTFIVHTEESSPTLDVYRIVCFCIIILFILLVIIATITQTVIFYCKKYLIQDFTSSRSSEPQIRAVIRSNYSYPSEEEINVLNSSSLEGFQQDEIARNSETVLTKVIKSFSLYSNIELLLSSPSNPLHSINCLAGIRSLSMFWILLGRSYLWCLYSGAISDVENLLTSSIKRVDFTLVWNGVSAMESLFIVSGCVAMFTSLKELNAPDKPNIIKYFVKYYLYHILRITPTYLILLFLMWKLTPLLGSGPMWSPTVDKIIGNCEENWWASALFIQTFYPSDYMETCLSWSFYIAIEIQFLLLSPLFIIPAHYLRAPFSLALPLLLFIITTCAPIPILILNDVNSHVDYIVNNYLELFNISQLIEHAQSLEIILINLYYNKFYFHYMMYMGGLMVGYILYKLPIWRSNSTSGIKFDRRLGLFCIIACPVAVLLPIALTLAPTWLVNGMPILPELVYTMLVVIKPLWAISVALLILCLALGFGGPVGALLSWKVWAPLSRLTFVVYLIHPIVMTVFFLTLRRTITYSSLTLAFIIAGLMVVSYAVSALISLFLYFPLKNILGVFSKKK